MTIVRNDLRSSSHFCTFGTQLHSAAGARAFIQDIRRQASSKERRRKRGWETGLLEKGCARAMLQLGSVYNSADYIPDRGSNDHGIVVTIQENSRTMNLSIIGLGSRINLPLMRVEKP